MDVLLLVAIAVVMLLAVVVVRRRSLVASGVDTTSVAPESPGLIAMVARRAPGVAAALIALGTDVLYVLIIRSQDSPDELTVVTAMAIMLATAGLLALTGSFARSERAGTRLLASAAAILIPLGILAIFSIGSLLLTAGFLAAAGAFLASKRISRLDTIGAILATGAGVGVFLIALTVALSAQ